MREIETEATRRGYQLAWAQGVSFILHGHRSLFQNLGGAAVKRVEVAVDEDEEVEFEAEGLIMAARLSKFGYKTTSIWYEAHLVPEDDELFKYHRIKAYNWSDPRLLRCIEVFALTEDDVHEFRRIFDKFPKEKGFNPLMLVGKDLSSTVGAMRQEVRQDKITTNDVNRHYA